MPLPAALAGPIMLLTEIRPEAYDVEIDLRYATPDNLTGRIIYRRAACYLHPEAAAALRKTATAARAIGLRLRILDAFRPIEAQWRFWEALPDPRYVADPRQGSNHNAGVAVDLTLQDPDGRALDMGTGFDEIDPRSHHASPDIPAEAQRNRVLLAGLMAVTGWESYAFEWWHYQLPSAAAYPRLSDSALNPGML
jgi:D-alanyl-D-alanine dipeptidase